MLWYYPPMKLSVPWDLRSSPALLTSPDLLCQSPIRSCAVNISVAQIKWADKTIIVLVCGYRVSNWVVTGIVFQASLDTGSRTLDMYLTGKPTTS